MHASQMNPWLRAAICVATGFVGGVFGIQVLGLLPGVVEVIAIALCLGGIAAYVVNTELWMREQRKQMGIALAKLREIEKASGADDG